MHQSLPLQDLWLGLEQMEFRMADKRRNPRGAIGLLLFLSLDCIGAFFGASPTARTSAELRSRLIAGYGQRLSPDETAAVGDLVAQLANSRARFDSRALEGGLWCVAWMSGPRPRWSLGGTQVAGQRYDLDGGVTTNYAELLGGAVSLVAEAELNEADRSVRTCPKDFELLVTSAAVMLPIGSLILPIRGRGIARLLYGDAGIRLLASPKESESGWEGSGLVVAQLPARDLLGQDWQAPAVLCRP